MLSGLLGHLYTHDVYKCMQLTYIHVSTNNKSLKYIKSHTSGYVAFPFILLTILSFPFCFFLCVFGRYIYQYVEA